MSNHHVESPNWKRSSTLRYRPVRRYTSSIEASTYSAVRIMNPRSSLPLQGYNTAVASSSDHKGTTIRFSAAHDHSVDKVDFRNT